MAIRQGYYCRGKFFTEEKEAQKWDAQGALEDALVDFIRKNYPHLPNYSQHNLVMVISKHRDTILGILQRCK